MMAFSVRGEVERREVPLPNVAMRAVHAKCDRETAHDVTESLTAYAVGEDLEVPGLVGPAERALRLRRDSCHQRRRDEYRAVPHERAA